MSRRVDAAAVSRILESVFLLRSAKLTGLVASAKAPRFSHDAQRQGAATHSSVNEAVRSAKDYFRDSILDAVEIEAPPAPSSESALAVVQTSLTTIDNDITAPSAKSWQPRREVGTVLEGRDLSSLDLSGVRLSASFNRSSLAHASLTGSYFAHCTFNSCDLRGADLAGCQFHSCTFMSADARDVNAHRAHFSHCTFHRADLCSWNATGATFFQCAFTLSDLTRWKVDGQTTVIKPTDWGRCRRLDWQMKPGSTVRQCRVVGDMSAVHALSLGPAHASACQRAFKTK